MCRVRVPKSALDAAVAAQRALELPVRMGIATGEAELRGVDYFGAVLNRATRSLGLSCLLNMACWRLMWTGPVRSLPVKGRLFTYAMNEWTLTGRQGVAIVMEKASAKRRVWPALMLVTALLTACGGAAQPTRGLGFASSSAPTVSLPDVPPPSPDCKGSVKAHEDIPHPSLAPSGYS